jgi:hypothetical protein
MYTWYVTLNMLLCTSDDYDSANFQRYLVLYVKTFKKISFIYVVVVLASSIKKASCSKDKKNNMVFYFLKKNSFVHDCALIHGPWHGAFRIPCVGQPMTTITNLSSSTGLIQVRSTPNNNFISSPIATTTESRHIAKVRIFGSRATWSLLWTVEKRKNG